MIRTEKEDTIKGITITVLYRHTCHVTYFKSIYQINKSFVDRLRITCSE